MPSLYELTIQPFFKPDKMPEFYNGKVLIHFTCKKDTNTLVLHMKDLELDKATLSLESSTDKDFKKKSSFDYQYDNVTHFFTAKFDQPFRTYNKYTFGVEFKGFTKDDELGFYRSYYFDENKNKKWLFTSQMEYIEARKSFISFDEPGFKSVFRITVIHDKSLNVLSNNVIKSTEAS